MRPQRLAQVVGNGPGVHGDLAGLERRRHSRGIVAQSELVQGQAAPARPIGIESAGHWLVHGHLVQPASDPNEMRLDVGGGYHGVAVNHVIERARRDGSESGPRHPAAQHIGKACRPGDHPLGRPKGRIGGIDEAQMQLALVVAARLRQGLGVALEEHHPMSPVGQL